MSLQNWGTKLFVICFDGKDKISFHGSHASLSLKNWNAWASSSLSRQLCVNQGVRAAALQNTCQDYTQLWHLSLMFLCMGEKCVLFNH